MPLQPLSRLVASVQADASRRAGSPPAAVVTQTQIEQMTRDAVSAVLHGTAPAPLVSAPHDPAIRQSPPTEDGPVDVSTFNSLQFIELGLNNSNPTFHPRKPDGTPDKLSKPRAVDFGGATDFEIIDRLIHNSRGSRG